MTIKRQWALVAGVVAALAGGLWYVTHTVSGEYGGVNIGSDAPGFLASTIDASSTTKSLSDYRGKVILLNVWATWCGPCRQEMPSIEALRQDYKDRDDFAIVAVSIDAPGKEQEIRDFVAEYGLTFEILHDPLNTISASYRVVGYPETFVIAKDGTIRKKWIGPDDWNSDVNRRFIEQMLAEPHS